MKECYGLGKTLEDIRRDKIKKLLSSSGRSSFELSGYATSKREWENISNFVNLYNPDTYNLLKLEGCNGKIIPTEPNALSDYLKGISL